MPPNGVKGFLNDYTLIPSKEDTHTPATCQQCEDNNNAVAYCNTCSHICNDCLAAHKRYKTFSSHKIVSHERGNGENEIKFQPKKTYYCAIHPEENLKVYCKSCQMLDCVHCFVKKHCYGHDIGTIDNETRMEAKNTICKLADFTDSKLKEFEANLKYISLVEKDKAKRCAPLKSEINKEINELFAKLEETRKQLLKDVDDACTKDLKELWAQKEYHETAITSMEGALSFARRALACKEDTELLALCAQVTSRLQELSQLKWDIQETEKIEITAVTYTLEVSDNVSVGEVDARIDEPTIEIEPIDMPSTFKPSETVTIKVMAAFANILNIMPRDHHDLELSGTVSYNFLYGGKTPFKEVAVEAAKNQNEWTVSFKPPGGTTSVTLDLEASGQYGQQLVEGSETFCLRKP